MPIDCFVSPCIIQECGLGRCSHLARELSQCWATVGQSQRRAPAAMTAAAGLLELSRNVRARNAQPAQMPASHVHRLIVSSQLGGPVLASSYEDGARSPQLGHMTRTYLWDGCTAVPERCKERVAKVRHMQRKRGRRQGGLPVHNMRHSNLPKHTSCTAAKLMPHSPSTFCFVFAVVDCFIWALA